MANTKFDSRQIVNRSALSFVGSSANEILSTIFPKINDELAKIFEDRNVLLTGGGTITNTGGTSLSFTSNFVLYINSNVAGAAPYSVSIDSSPWAFSADGRMAYITITSRSAGTFTLTTDASSLPAVTSANQEVFLIAKRVGTTIYLRNGSSVASGASIILGSVSAGGADTQVQYNASGTLAGSANLVWDYTNNRLGIRNSSPTTILTIGSPTTGSPIAPINTNDIHKIALDSAGNGATFDTFGSSTSITGRRAQGTSASKTAIVNTAIMLRMTGYGWDGASVYGQGGSIDITGSGTWNAGSYPTDIIFRNVAASSTTLTERMRINSAGQVGIGTTPSSLLHMYHATAAVSFLQGDSATQSYLSRYSTDASSSDLFFRKARGSVSGGAALVATDDVIGRMMFQVYGGSNFRDIAYIQSAVDTYTSDTDISSRIQFFTTPTGSVTAVERMRIDPSGQVGIGTTPSDKLEIKGILRVTSSASADYSRISTDGTALKFTTSSSSVGVRMGTGGGTTAILIDGSVTVDRVGIAGAPFTTWSSTLKTLELGGGAGIAPFTFVQDSTNKIGYQSENLYNDGVSWKYKINGTAALLTMSSTNFDYVGYTSGTAGNPASTVVNRLTVDSTGMYNYTNASSSVFVMQNTTTGTTASDGLELGIATSSAVYLRNREAAVISLLPQGQSASAIDADWNGAGGLLYFNGASGVHKGYIEYNNGTTNMNVVAQSGVGLQLATLGAQDVKILSNSVVVSTVNATSASMMKTVNATATASSTARIYDAQYTADADCTGGYFYTCLNSSGTIIGRIEAATNTTTTFTGSSDSRLKQNPSSFNGLELVNRIIPKEFEWISNPEKRVKGFYAQELYEVIPEAVSVGSDELTEDGSLRNPWGADYSKIVPVLAKAIQELSAELNSLKASLGK